jgi:hypothetical protein
MIDIQGNKGLADEVHCFESHNSLFMAIKVVELALKLGLTIAKRDDGVKWISFERDGMPLTNVSFFDAANAYAFLLGVASQLKSATD